MGQLLLWLLLIAPWLLLIPLDLKRVRHFLSAAFFATLLSTICWQMGDVWN